MECRPLPKNLLLIPNTSDMVISDITCNTSSYQVRTVNLQSAFRFWPISVAGVCDGWVYGTSTPLISVLHRELLEKRRLSVRRNKGAISEAHVKNLLLHHEAMGVALEGSRIPVEAY